jgi:DNA polymerase-3 subunit epsilon
MTASEHVPPEKLSEVYGVFRTKRQAYTHLDALAKAHGLCPQLLGLERNSGTCFSRQLGFCRGACTGDISPDYYNLLVEHAFAETRLRAWPFSGPITISYTNDDVGITERITVDQWVITAAECASADAPVALFSITELNFDYDFYRILAKHLLKSSLTPHLRIEYASS